MEESSDEVRGLMILRLLSVGALIISKDVCKSQKKKSDMGVAER